MRLIDAQALLQEHCFCLSPTTKDYGAEWHKASCDECLKDGGFCGLEVSGDVIWNAPTVEAEPVKHGKWEQVEVVHDRKDAKIQDWQQAKCSVCGKWHTTPFMYYLKLDNYCPNCGAQMIDKSEVEE